jgi:erythromycin esterase
MKRVPWPILLLAVTACGGGGSPSTSTTPAPDQGAVVSWVQQRSLSFDTDDPTASSADLQPFKAMVGPARVVALGEGTHGTAEFFRMKHRLFEYLVERKGFTVFAFETNWPAVEIVDRYVKTGEGTAAKALEALHEVWRTQEVRDLIEWMRAYNSAPGRTKLLSFTGFDMQDPVTAIDCVIGAFDKLGGSDAKTMRDLYTGAGAEGSSVGDTVEKAKARFVDAAKLVEARREALGAHYERVHRCTTVALQLVQIDIGAGLTAYSNARDKAMAENVRWLAESVYPNERIALWAHNGHIATAPEANGPVPMGQHLRQMFATRLRVVGFAFDRGEVLHIPFGASGPDAGKAMAVKVPPASLASAEGVLKGAGLPRFILDLRAVPVGSALGAWLAQPQKLRRMGWGGVAPDDPASAYPTVALYDTLLLPKAFDVLVYIEASTATALLK